MPNKPWIQDISDGDWYQDSGMVFVNNERGQRIPILKADRDTDKTAPWERDANVKLAALAKAMLGALSIAESALHYARTEGTFSSKETTADVINAHQILRALLIHIEDGEIRREGE